MNSKLTNNFLESSETIVSRISCVNRPQTSFHPDMKFQLLMDIERMTSLNEIDSVISAISRYYGYDLFASISVFSNFSGQCNMVYHVEKLNKWSEHYRREKYFVFDPTFQHSKTTCAPFEWSIHSYGKKVKHKLSEKQHRIVTEAIDFGLTQVVSIPMHINYKNYGLFRFINVNAPPKDHREIFELTSQSSMLLAFVFEKALSIYAKNEEKESRDVAITRREKEVLQSISLGQSPSQISDSLRISEHTVRKHIKSVREKFGVATVTHAVVKAIRRNDIFV